MSSGIFSYSFYVGFALPRLMMFGDAAFVLFFLFGLEESLIQCLSHKFIRISPPLCTSAHFQHLQLQSIIWRYDIPASLISTQHWCFFWTFSWNVERHCWEWRWSITFGRFTSWHPVSNFSLCSHRANSVGVVINLIIHKMRIGIYLAVV